MEKSRAQEVRENLLLRRKEAPRKDAAWWVEYLLDKIDNLSELNLYPLVVLKKDISGCISVKIGGEPEIQTKLNFEDGLMRGIRDKFEKEQGYSVTYNRDKDILSIYIYDNESITLAGL